MRPPSVIDVGHPMACTVIRGVQSESESPEIQVLARSRILSFEGDSNSRPYLSHRQVNRNCDTHGIGVNGRTMHRWPDGRPGYVTSSHCLLSVAEANTELG